MFPGCPLVREKPEDCFVGVCAVHPGGASQRSFPREPHASRCREHRGVVREGLDLKPLQPAHGESVFAQDLQDVDAEAAAAERRPQGDPDVGRPVMCVDTPEEGFAGEFLRLELDDGEARRLIRRPGHSERRKPRHRRDGLPRTGIGPRPRDHIIVELRVQNRHIVIVPGTQRDLLTLDHEASLRAAPSWSNQVSPWMVMGGDGLTSGYPSDATEAAVQANITSAGYAATTNGVTTGALHADGASKCLDDPSGSTTGGTQMQIWGCNGQTNQVWTHTSANQLTITNNGTTDCLDANGQGTTAGTKVIIWPCNGNSNQQWQFNSNGTITGVQSGLCLDVTGGSTADGALEGLVRRADPRRMAATRRLPQPAQDSRHAGTAGLAAARPASLKQWRRRAGIVSAFGNAGPVRCTA